MRWHIDASAVLMVAGGGLDLAMVRAAILLLITGLVTYGLLGRGKSPADIGAAE